MHTKQIIFTGPRVAELMDVECLPPQENEVTVSLEYSAISAGTERANFIGERNGINVAENDRAIFPRAVGYSAAGIVTAKGANVNGIECGDRVVVHGGKHKKNITIHKNGVVKIPDEVPSEQAAIAFIATFPLAAIRKTKLEIGESAMVMGLGILGLLAVQELKAAGAYPVIGVDPIKERRDLALKTGADYVFDPTSVDLSQEIKQLCGGVNVCIEVTGLGAGLVQALDCMRKMGRVALLGCTRRSDFSIDYYGKVHGPGISLIGAHTNARPEEESAPGLWTHKDDLTAVLNLLKGQRLHFNDLISETHSPYDAQKIFDRLADDKNFPIGVLFDWRNV